MNDTKVLETDINALDEIRNPIHEHRHFQMLESYSEEKIKDHQLRILSTEKEMLDNNMQKRIIIDDLKKELNITKRNRNISYSFNVLFLLIIGTLLYFLISEINLTSELTD